MTEQVQMAIGRTATTMCPSGRVFIIREQNGNDDDILSNPVARRDLSNYDNFLLAICLKEITNGEEVPITLSIIQGLLTNDRTHLLIFSRVHTIGNIMKFEYDFGDDPDTGGKFSYEEDLSQYLHDYSKDFPKEGEEGYFKYKIPPYPQGCYEEQKFTTTTGRELKFNLYNRQSEKYMLKLEPERINNSAQLRAMNLSLLNPSTNKFSLIENFSMFNKREMIEIQRMVSEVSNTTYMAISEIVHPRTQEMVSYPIIASPDFFFPTEV